MERLCQELGVAIPEFTQPLINLRSLVKNETEWKPYPLTTVVDEELLPGKGDASAKSGKSENLADRVKLANASKTVKTEENSAVDEKTISDSRNKVADDKIAQARPEAKDHRSRNSAVKTGSGVSHAETVPALTDDIKMEDQLENKAEDQGNSSTEDEGESVTTDTPSPESASNSKDSSDTSATVIIKDLHQNWNKRSAQSASPDLGSTNKPRPKHQSSSTDSEARSISDCQPDAKKLKSDHSASEN